ncbi:MAG TPA: 50S ribosomal protein L34e [archaeon]|nr:50S ribosomal protein L34e [archaeon]
MVRRALRSSRLKKIKRVAPSGKTVTHYERRRPGRALCSTCKGLLAGVPRLRQAKLHKLSKSKYRPKRTYGGVLCPSCLKHQLRNKAIGL